MTTEAAALRVAQQCYPRRRVLSVTPVIGQPEWAILGSGNEFLGYIVFGDGRWMRMLIEQLRNPVNVDAEGDPVWEEV